MEGYKRAEIRAIVGMHAKKDYSAPLRSTGSHGGGADQSGSGDSKVGERAENLMRLGGLSGDEVTIMEGVFACGTTTAKDCVVPFKSGSMYMLPAEAGPAPKSVTHIPLSFMFALSLHLALVALSFNILCSISNKTRSTLRDVARPRT